MRRMTPSWTYSEATVVGAAAGKPRRWDQPGHKILSAISWSAEVKAATWYAGHSCHQEEAEAEVGNQGAHLGEGQHLQGFWWKYELTPDTVEGAITPRAVRYWAVWE